MPKTCQKRMAGTEKLSGFVVLVGWDKVAGEPTQSVIQSQTLQRMQSPRTPAHQWNWNDLPAANGRGLHFRGGPAWWAGVVGRREAGPTCFPTLICCVPMTMLEVFQRFTAPLVSSNCAAGESFLIRRLRRRLGRWQLRLPLRRRGIVALGGLGGVPGFIDRDELRDGGAIVVRAVYRLEAVFGSEE